jgi:hypothetical protein
MRKLKYLPDGLGKTHNAQDCQHLAKFNRHLEEGVEVEKQPLIQKENYAGQRSSSHLSQSKSAQYKSESISKRTISVLRRSATLHTSVSNSTANISANVVTSAVLATWIAYYWTMSTWKQRPDGS